jgi:hypothetical protein
MQIATASLEDVSVPVELLSTLFAEEAEFSPDPAAQARGLSKILGDPEIGFIAVAKDQTTSSEW